MSSHPPNEEKRKLEGYAPRINVVIGEELNSQLNKFLPYGMRKSIFVALTEALVANLKENPGMTIAAILNKSVGALDLVAGGEPPQMWLARKLASYKESKNERPDSLKEFIKFIDKGK